VLRSRLETADESAALAQGRLQAEVAALWNQLAVVEASAAAEIHAAGAEIQRVAGERDGAAAELDQLRDSEASLRRANADVQRELSRQVSSQGRTEAALQAAAANCVLLSLAEELATEQVRTLRDVASTLGEELADVEAFGAAARAVFEDQVAALTLELEHARDSDVAHLMSANQTCEQLTAEVSALRQQLHKAEASAAAANASMDSLSQHAAQAAAQDQSAAVAAAELQGEVAQLKLTLLERAQVMAPSPPFSPQ
jgi:chromosome segregation ATPase